MVVVFFYSEKFLILSKRSGEDRKTLLSNTSDSYEHFLFNLLEVGLRFLSNSGSLNLKSIADFILPDPLLTYQQPQRKFAR